MPLRVVMESLGHSQIGLTADTYGHIAPEVQRAAAERMEELLHKLDETAGGDGGAAGDGAGTIAGGDGTDGVSDGVSDVANGGETPTGEGEDSAD